MAGMAMHTRIARFLAEHFTIMVVGAWAVIGTVGLVVHRPTDPFPPDLDRPG